MTKKTEKSLVNIRLKIIQIKENHSYNGWIEIGNLWVAYGFESMFPIREIDIKKLRRYEKPVLRIFYSIRVITCKGEKLGQTKKEFIFFQNLIHPNLELFGKDERICWYNKVTGGQEVIQNRDEGYPIDDLGNIINPQRRIQNRCRKRSIGKPIDMMIKPELIYPFDIRIGEIPETIRALI